MNGMTITVRRVYYCEQSRSTLLSITAFKKSRGLFRVNNNFDAINLLSRNGSLLLKSTFDSKNNLWPLEKPIRVKAVYMISVEEICTTRDVHNLAMNSVYKPPTAIEHSKFTWHPKELSANEKSLFFWHRLFGHASLRKIRQMVKLKLGYGLPEKMPLGTIKCPVCSICKATRQSELSSSKRCTDKLPIICVDLMGPFDPPTMTGGQYAMTFCNVYTSCSKVKILKSKAEACNLLILTIKRWENQALATVNILRSDNRGEFNLTKLANFLAEKGIIA
jgi:hypothetical protein